MFIIIMCAVALIFVITRKFIIIFLYRPICKNFSGRRRKESETKENLGEKKYDLSSLERGSDLQRIR